MTDTSRRAAFLEACDAWICNGYSLSLRFMAGVDERGSHIWDAAVLLNPLPASYDDSFRIDIDGLIAGQIRREGESKQALLTLVARIASGVIELPDRSLVLPSSGTHYFHSEMTLRDRWFSQLHLQMLGTSSQTLGTPDGLARIDTGLRTATPPFDGLGDLARWLGLKSPTANAEPASISLFVNPPVDLFLDRCSLAADRLQLTLHAHPDFDIARAGLALRAIPGAGLESRRQVAPRIQWDEVGNDRREGVLDLEIPNADSVLAMLTIGGSTVRRNWFLDPAKARSNRLLAIRHFDKDLRMVRQSVLEAQDSARFENGVSSLLFMLGFTASVQLETDAPDVLVTTPTGRIAIVECTMRTSDIAAKIGKLVDRRGALSRALQAGGHPASVLAVLVCRQPADQIAADAGLLRSCGILLLTREHLEQAFERVGLPNDPEQLFDDAHTAVTGGEKVNAD